VTITTHCPNCATRYQVRDDSVGASARCKKCDTKFTVAIALDETPKKPVSVAEAVEPKSVAKPSQRVDNPSRPVVAPNTDLPTQPVMQPAGDTKRKQIGKYLIRSQLGAGGMGEVWLGHDPDLQRNVAIKLLPEISQDEESLKRFMREARLAAKLHHTNTVAVYEVGVDNNRVFIAMELVDGQSLDKTIEVRGALPWTEATKAVCDAAAGLVAAHELGLIHRDIKPANLMRTTKGVTKVVDFGLARAQAGESRLTQEKMILGTPAYMSPEQWMGSEIDARTDLYSLTCTYYQLLTGHAPFDAPSFAALGYQHRHEPFPDPRQHQPALPDAVCRILARGSQKIPDARYQSAAELHANLSTLLSMPSASLTAGTPWQKLSEQATVQLVEPVQPVTLKLSTATEKLRKHPVLAGAIALGFFGAIVAFAIIFSRAPRPEPLVDLTKAYSPPTPITIDRSATETSDPSPPTATPTSVQTSRSTPEAGSNQSLELLEEVEAEFTPVSQVDGGKIDESRTKTLGELKSKMFELSRIIGAMSQPTDRMWRGPTFDQPTTQQFIDLPTRFMLTGKLGAVRVQGRSTWVYLWVAPTNGINAMPGSMSSTPVPPVAGVEFPDADLTQDLADYSVGDDVCVVVKRQAAPQESQQERSLHPPSRLPRSWNTGGSPPMLQTLVPEFRRFAGGMTYWTLQGEALEKSQQPATWIDAQLGRAEKLTNAEKVRRSPGQMMRYLSRCAKTRGILVAKFQSVSTSSTTGNVSLRLQIPDTSEGTIAVVADMGNQVSAKDFLDYHAGDEVVAAVRLKSPDSRSRMMATIGTLPAMIQSYAMSGSRFPIPHTAFADGSAQDPSLGSTDPLTAWTGFSVDCSQINKTNDPSSMVAPGVKRDVKLSGNITPDQASNNPDGSVGLEVVWTGKLSSLRQLNGEAHFAISGTGDTPGSFEAYTTTPNFIDEVADYTSKEEDSSAADTVTVAGRLVAAKSTKKHLSPSQPLVMLTKISRTDIPQSTAEPGKNRPADSFAEGPKLTELMALSRKPSEVLPNDAKDRLGAKVVWIGSLKDICQLGAETHVMIDGDDPTDGTFEAFTKSPDFLAQLVDYVTYEENFSAEDTVIVTGTVATRRAAAASLSKSDHYPLIELTEIRRPDQPSSIARPDRPREANSFDTHRQLSGWAALQRNPPAVGTEVKFRAIYDSYWGTPRRKHAYFKSDKEHNKSFNMSFPNTDEKDFARFEQGDLVEVTAVVTKVDVSSRAWPMELEGRNLSRVSGNK
jgi:predicted Zn finger-like uncharacterized protein